MNVKDIEEAKEKIRRAEAIAEEVRKENDELKKEIENLRSYFLGVGEANERERIRQMELLEERAEEIRTLRGEIEALEK